MPQGTWTDMVLVWSCGFSSLLVVLACCSPLFYFHPSLASASPADFKLQHQGKDGSVDQLPQYMRSNSHEYLSLYTHTRACVHAHADMHTPPVVLLLWSNYDCHVPPSPRSHCFIHHNFISGPSRVSGEQHNLGHPRILPSGILELTESSHTLKNAK